MTFANATASTTVVCSTFVGLLGRGLGDQRQSGRGHAELSVAIRRTWPPSRSWPLGQAAGNSAAYWLADALLMIAGVSR
jgi:hypothetical protein